MRPGVLREQEADRERGGQQRDGHQDRRLGGGHEVGRAVDLRAQQPEEQRPQAGHAERHAELLERLQHARRRADLVVGHTGQDALQACMRRHGGFEHNLQSLRVVDILEQRYAAFDGLNLTFETREGILKHCSRQNARALGDVGERFLKRQRPSLEAQLANLSDEIAYNNHDIDDGLRSGLLSLEQISAVKIFARHRALVLREFPRAAGRRLIHETVRRMIDTLVTDLIQTSAANIRKRAPASIEEVRRAPPLIAFSPRIRGESHDLKRFLSDNLYRHYRVTRMSTKARRIVTDLFQAFMSDQRLLPPEFQARAEDNVARAIADYIAGMTDRYAILEHRRLFAIEET